MKRLQPLWEENGDSNFFMRVELFDQRMTEELEDFTGKFTL